MNEHLFTYCQTVRSSSQENETAMKLLIDNRLYKKAVATLREELELYVRTLYVWGQQDPAYKKQLLLDFTNNQQWKDAKGKRLTDRTIIEYANTFGWGWEKMSYQFSCCFIHLSVLHNWENEEVTNAIPFAEKKIVIDYINNYHNTKLTYYSSFEEIVQYVMPIFEKIKGNLEYYIADLEKQI